MNGYKEKRNTILMILLWVSVVMGSSYLGISLSGFTLSPYRIVFIIAIGIVCMDRYINIPQNAQNEYYFYLLWVIVSLLSLVWARDKTSCFKAGIVIIIGFFSMIVTSQFVNNVKNIHSILITISLLSMFVTWLGLYESLTGHYFFVNNETILSRMSIDKYRAPLVFFTNQNDFSLFLVFGMLVSVYVCGTLKNKLIKVIYYITLIVDIWLLLFAGARGCVLALGLGTFVWLFFKIRDMKSYTKTLLVLLFIFAILFLVIVYSDMLFGFYNSFFHFGLVSSSTTSDSTRWQLLKNGINMFLLSGGIGVGAANSSYYLQHVYSNTHGIWALHNWFMQIFSEFGFWVGIGYVIQYIWQFKMLTQKYHNSIDSMEKNQASLFIAILCMLLVGTISPSSVLTMEWLWMTFGLIITYIGLPAEGMEESE